MLTGLLQMEELSKDGGNKVDNKALDRSHQIERI